MTEILKFENVSHQYRENSASIVALRKISFSIVTGEFVAVVGPSGSGKSTMINIAGGFLQPTAGSVRSDTQSRRPVVAFQTDAVFGWMTVADNVSYSLRLRGMPPNDARQKAEEYLRKVQLDGQGDRWPRDLSGGMRKRVELARAFAAASPLMLLDEAFGSLDVLTREAMQVLLQEIRRETHTSVLLATHDIEEAVFLADRILVLTPGPGSVSTTVEVPFAFPRHPSLKLDDGFIEVRRTVVAALGSNKTRGTMEPT